MEYYLHLAKEQWKRYEEYVATHPKNNRLTNREEFFGQHYERFISFTITQGIAGADKYNENHPVKP